MSSQMMDVQRKLHYLEWIAIFESSKQDALIAYDALPVLEVSLNKLSEIHGFLVLFEYAIALKPATVVVTAIQLHFVVGSFCESLDFIVSKNKSSQTFEVA